MKTEIHQSGKTLLTASEGKELKRTSDQSTTWGNAVLINADEVGDWEEIDEIYRPETAEDDRINALKILGVEK